MAIALNEEWLKELEGEFEKPNMVQLRAFLNNARANSTVVYPRNSDIFNALNTTPLSEVKVVILGQDPYHGQGQAHGLSFSVRKGVAIPPSLKNIYTELINDVEGFNPPAHGELTEWAKQGVLLLNSTLTVEAGMAGSHQKAGWEPFTDAIIKLVSDKLDHVVFLLWGKFAQNKATLINTEKHLVLKAAHPSPFSAHSGFFGSRPFSKANAYLAAHGKVPINWAAINN